MKVKLVLPQWPKQEKKRINHTETCQSVSISIGLIHFLFGFIVINKFSLFTFNECSVILQRVWEYFKA